jgi:hypothetical protein
MMNDEGFGFEIFPLKSRVLRAVYYDMAKQKMVLELTRGKIRIYKNIEEDLVRFLVAHHAPGMLYDQYLKAALKPLLCNSASHFFLLRHIRQIAKSSPERMSLAPQR